MFDDKGYSDIQEQRPIPIEELERKDFVSIDSLHTAS
jgi:hypothetical protein